MRLVTGLLTLTVLLLCRSSLRARTPPALKVEGKQLKTSAGKVVRLRGVNIPSLEWGQGDHLFQSLVVAIDGWGAKVVRLPLSQDRWFGQTQERRDGGAGYQKTVREFVDRATAKQCYVILDLHWSNAGTRGEHIGQHKMPDENSVRFWENLAAVYANHPAVLFGLYNEPHHVSWEVWRNGGSVVEDAKRASTNKLEYHSPGMQKLLDVCRDKGANNVVLIGGLDWGYDLSGVTKGYAVTDPRGSGVVYDTHIYPVKKDWDRFVTPAADKYPVLVGEFGVGRGEPGEFVAQLLEYADKHDLHWIAWCLHRDAQPNLIKDWSYTPTAFGAPVKKALLDGTTRSSGD